MLTKLKIKQAFYLFLILLVITLIFIFQEESKNGAIYGLYLSGNVIIPSLFPFTVCVLMLTRMGFSRVFNIFKKIIYRIFGINSAEFSAFFLSFIGGYPVGAKMLDALYPKEFKGHKKPQLMLCYCVNAGPAFIVLAVGNGVLGSKTLGLILLISHIFSSLIIALILSPFLRKETTLKEPLNKSVSFGDAFVESAADAATTVFNICAFVILFSALTSILDSLKHNIFDYISDILEVTTAIAKTNNIYLISFLLGFGGISVWLQVFSCCKKFKVNIFLFAIFRLLHGALSVIITHLLLKIVKIDVSAISNNIDTNPSVIYKTPTLAVSLIAMVILLIISLEQKFDSRNLKRDLL